jgi:DDE domain
VARIVIAGIAMNRGPLLRWSIAGKTHVKAAGERAYLCRAVDQHRQVIDLLLSERPDLAEAPPIFSRDWASPDEGGKADCGISGDQQ